MMVPVRMPGSASGSTWWNTICILDWRPCPAPPARIDGGTERSAARVAMMMVGSVISVSTRPPTRGAERGRPKKLMNTASAEQAEDDRGHRGEIVDVDLDEVGEAVLLARTPRDRSRRRRRSAAHRASTISIM